MKQLDRVVGEYLFGTESLKEFGMQQAIYTQHASLVPFNINSYVRSLYTEMAYFFSSKLALNIVSGYNLAWIAAGDEIGVKPIIILGSELVRWGMSWHREDQVQDHMLLRKSVVHRKTLEELEMERREDERNEARVRSFFNPPDPNDPRDRWQFE